MPVCGRSRPSGREHAAQALGQPEAGDDADDRGEERRRPAPRAATEPSTWRREAPIVRSSASSRERWATVIDSVLKIVNAPTNIAMPPNTSRNVVMIDRNCLRPSRCSGPASRRSRPWLTAGPRAGRAQLAPWTTPGRGRREDRVVAAPRSRTGAARCARSNIATVAVPIDFDVAERDDAGDAEAPHGPPAWRSRTRVADAAVLLLGRAESIDDLVGTACAQRPDVRRNGVSLLGPGVAGVVARRRSTGRRRRPCRSLPMTFAVSSVMSPTATPTPGTAADLGQRGRRHGRRACTPLSVSTLNAVGRRPRRRCPSRRRLESESAALRIVSVSVSAPATIATPSTMASAVSDGAQPALRPCP